MRKGLVSEDQPEPFAHVFGTALTTDFSLTLWTARSARVVHDHPVVNRSRRSRRGGRVLPDDRCTHEPPKSSPTKRWVPATETHRATQAHQLYYLTLYLADIGLFCLQSQADGGARCLTMTASRAG